MSAKKYVTVYSDQKVIKGIAEYQSKVGYVEKRIITKAEAVNELLLKAIKMELGEEVE